MLNNFLSQLLFGGAAVSSSSTDTTTKTEQTSAISLMSDTTNCTYLDDIDWVIVDPAKQNKLNDLKRSLNLTRSLTESYSLNTLFNTDNYIDDSLNSDGGDHTPIEMEHDQQQWFVTPLPALITSQQQQQQHKILMTNNHDHGFENLLIEHPSMSVFIKVDHDDDDDDENDDDIQQEQQKPKIEQDIEQPVQIQQKHKKSKNKRKNQNMTKTAVVNALQPASSTCPKLCKFVIMNNQKQQQAKLNGSIQHTNTRQRKYHNLQQPKFF